MKVNVPVSPYVYKFLLKKYGHGPYDLDGTRKRNKLRLAFRYMHISAEATTPLRRIPGFHIQLDLGNDNQLIKLNSVNQDLLKAGLFFEHEFVQAMKGFIEAQRALAQKKELTQSEWNVSESLSDFLEFYEITPDEYDWESAYRRLTRHKHDDRLFFAAKLSQKFGFCHSDNQHFRLAALGGQKKVYIDFWCFSRSKEDLARKTHRIPAQIVAWGKAEDYARSAIEVINDFLIRGYTVA